MRLSVQTVWFVVGVLLLGDILAVRGRDDDAPPRTFLMDYGKTVRRHVGPEEFYDGAEPEGMVDTPGISTESVQASAADLGCSLCLSVSKHVLQSAVGFMPLGQTFNTRFNTTLSSGSISEVFDGLCEIRGGASKQELDADSGVPPRTISEFYEIFVDQETERLHIVSRAEGIRAQLITKGKHKVLESAANMVFLYVCEQSLLTIELELIESFEALLQRNLKVLESLDWNSREMYARMLFDSDAMDSKMQAMCSRLCAKVEIEVGNTKTKRRKRRKKHSPQEQHQTRFR